MKLSPPRNKRTSELNKLSPPRRLARKSDCYVFCVVVIVSKCRQAYINGHTLFVGA
jgi:hypothetical protein